MLTPSKTFRRQKPPPPAVEVAPRMAPRRKTAYQHGFEAAPISATPPPRLVARERRQRL